MGDQRVERLIIAGDSMCTHMCIRREGSSFKPYFQNRVAEIVSNLAELEQLVDVMEPTQKVDGEANPADVCTRPGVTMEQIGAGSVWINGPEFLKWPRELWPLTLPDEPSAVPQGELRKAPKKEVSVADVCELRMGIILEGILARSSSLKKVTNVTARVLRA